MGDTHNQMRNVDQIVELFRVAAVERVIHTGDITQPQVLERFAGLDVPVLGVFGNNDEHERERLSDRAEHLGIDLTDPPRTIEWAGRQILILHDPEPVPDSWPPNLDLILHGHTHRARHEYHGETLIFNPGECAGFMQGRNAVGLVDLETLVAERLLF